MIETILKANLLGGMNCYLQDLGDENAWELWTTEGLPDECTEEELMEIAEDDEMFADISALFAKIAKKYGVK